jgi:hypothetical protein
MTPLAAALLLLIAAPPDKAPPLPDAKSIDSVTFAIGSEIFPATGQLTVTATGKVTYRDQPGLYTTGSGGPVTSAEWEIPKADAAKLIAGLVADGLLDLPGRVTHAQDTRFIVASGKWKMYLHASPVPEKLMARLQPLLEKADPRRWKPRPAPEPAKPSVTHFEFTRTLPDGQQVTFGFWRPGGGSYVRRRLPGDPKGAGAVATAPLSIDKDEAGKLLDALTAAGVLDLKDAPPGTASTYHVQVFSGRWTIETHPAELPEALMKHLRPVLEKADPEVWKKR